MTGRTIPPNGIYSIAELARREGVDPKSARGRLRKYFGGTLSDLGISDWTYGPEDLEFVLSIIRPNRDPSTSLPRVVSTKPFSPIVKKPIELSPFIQREIAGDANPYSWIRRPRTELSLPRVSGVYALFLKEESSLLNVTPLTGGLIYIGLGRNLLKRCHFNGKTEGHSPRAQLGCVVVARTGT